MAKKPFLMHSPVPILRVQNLDVSLEYYTTRLGFEIAWQMPGYGSVRRDGCSLMLCEGGQGHAGTWMWIPANVELLYAEWSASGAIILQPPTNFPWGSCELQISDPDGHRLRFASDLKEGQPMGDFLEDRTEF